MSLPTRSTSRNAVTFATVTKEFDTMLSHLFNAPVNGHRPGGRVAEYFPTPYGVDVREDADHLYVEADLPGFKKDEVELTLEDQTLTLVAEHKPAPADAAPVSRGEYLLNERRPVAVRRSFKLPATVGEQVASATLADGVLTVVLAKREETKPRKIVVQ